ncbi:MAG: hypothetical protein ACR2LA_02720 [Acidimicrobiales bacterium]
MTPTPRGPAADDATSAGRHLAPASSSTTIDDEDTGQVSADVRLRHVVKREPTFSTRACSERERIGVPEYERRDGGKVNTDYRSEDAHLADDGTIFSSGDPFDGDHPDGVYGRDDGGVVDTRYRDGDTYQAKDGSVFYSPEAE